MGREVMRRRIDPTNEILFAARMGFLTKAMWKEFFANGKMNWQNKRWRYFRSSGIFRGEEEWPDVLLPNPDHPLVASTASYVSRPPRLSQFRHDEIIARSDLIIRKGLPGIEIEVEAELKRLHPVKNPGEALTMDQKYPDLLITSGGGRVAVEIEQSAKSKARYLQAFHCYQNIDVGLVIYVIASAALKSVIESAADDADFPEGKLGFSALKEWRSNPLGATVLIDGKARKFREVVR